MEGGLLLDVVVGEGSAILKLLSSEDETLLVRGDPFLVLDLGLYIVDSVGRLDLESDGLAGDCEGVVSLANTSLYFRHGIQSSPPKLQLGIIIRGNEEEEILKSLADEARKDRSKCEIR